METLSTTHNIEKQKFTSFFFHGKKTYVTTTATTTPNSKKHRIQNMPRVTSQAGIPQIAIQYSSLLPFISILKL